MAIAVKIEEQEYQWLLQYKKDTGVPMTQALTQAVRYWRQSTGEAKREILQRKEFSDRAENPVSVFEEGE